MRDMEREIQNVLGRNMKYYRRLIGLSQESLADKALLHRSYVGATERGKRNICLANLARIAEALEIEPCQLLADRHCYYLRSVDEKVASRADSHDCKSNGSHTYINDDVEG